MEIAYLRKLENSDVPIWMKVEKPHSFVILRGLKGIRGDKEFFQKSAWNIFVAYPCST